jgi:outer membrane protein OmpA-like peptidoglycan-associated protein
MIRNLALTALLVCLGSTAAAQGTEMHYRSGERVDPRDVARILSAAPIKTRSIRLLDGPGGGGTAPATSAPASPSALSIPVRFAFDSAEILPAARPQLDSIAAGIKMLPAPQPVIIEGHTDSVGAEEYNLDLSKRRAASVKRYLVEVHGIDAGRLKDAGFGEERPIQGMDPAAAENRRVQFRGS